MASALRVGSFSAWLRQTRRVQALRVVGTGGAEVPCGTCSGCCRSSYFIHIRPEETEALRRIPKALVFPAPGAPKGHVLMGYNERGECPMWRGGACAIYEHRPQTCRDYDCRVFAATGMTADDDGLRGLIEEQARRWRFDVNGAEEQAELDAVRAAARFLDEHRALFLEGQLPRNPPQLAALAIEVYDVFLGLGSQDEPRPPDAEIAKAVLAAMRSSDREPPPKPRSKRGRQQR